MDFDGAKELFIEESKENIQVIDDCLLLIESEGVSANSIDELFRAAHTLKGMAATMGYDDMVSLTHNFESFMGMVRDGKVDLATKHVDILLECSDLIKALVDGEPLGDSDCIARLMGFVGEVVDTCVDDEGIRYQIKMALPHDEFAKGPRYLLVFKALRECACIKSMSLPEEVVSDISDDEFDGQLTLEIMTNKTSDEVESILHGAASFSKIEIVDLSEDLSQEDAGDEREVEVEIIDKSHVREVFGKTVRIESNKIDSFINLVGELVIEKNRLEVLNSSLESEELRVAIEQLDRKISHLQENVMKVRMIPINSTFQVFPKLVRKIAKELRKPISFEIRGGNTELDRSIVEKIKDPILHLLRNSMDHGLEDERERRKSGKPLKGHIRLSAGYEGNQVVITVCDDGRGIDVSRVVEKAIRMGAVTESEVESMTEEEKLRLIASPGLSTAKKVTDLSGRGVGLDVVRDYVEQLNGSFEIESVLGEGSTMTLRLPLTLAIIKSMMVMVGGEKYSIPLGYIDTILAISDVKIDKINGQEVLMYRGSACRAYSLHSLVGCPGENSGEYMLIIKRAGGFYGLIVDEIVGQQEVVIKSVGPELKGVDGFSGATILGDGSVALILDTTSLI